MVPSLRWRRVSKGLTRSPTLILDKIASSSAYRSGKMMRLIDVPIISAAENPKILSAAGFQLVTMPVQVFADDRVVRILDDCGQHGRGELYS